MEWKQWTDEDKVSKVDLIDSTREGVVNAFAALNQDQQMQSKTAKMWNFLQFSLFKEQIQCMTKESMSPRLVRDWCKWKRKHFVSAFRFTFQISLHPLWRRRELTFFIESNIDASSHFHSWKNFIHVSTLSSHSLWICCERSPFTTPPDIETHSLFSLTERRRPKANNISPLIDIC